MRHWQRKEHKTNENLNSTSSVTSSDQDIITPACGLLFFRLCSLIVLGTNAVTRLEHIHVLDRVCCNGSPHHFVNMATKRQSSLRIGCKKLEEWSRVVLTVVLQTDVVFIDLVVNCKSLAPIPALESLNTFTVKPLIFLCPQYWQWELLQRQEYDFFDLTVMYRPGVVIYTPRSKLQIARPLQHWEGTLLLRSSMYSFIPMTSWSSLWTLSIRVPLFTCIWEYLLCN